MKKMAIISLKFGHQTVNIRLEIQIFDRVSPRRPFINK